MQPSTIPAHHVSRPGRVFWIVAGLALLWNLAGVASYLMTVSQGPEAWQSVPEVERVLYQDIPAWATAAYALAVFGGALGSVLLLGFKAAAVPVFWLSLAAIVMQMAHAFILTPMLQIRGAASAVPQVVIIVLAVARVVFSRSTRQNRRLV